MHLPPSNFPKRRFYRRRFDTRLVIFIFFIFIDVSVTARALWLKDQARPVSARLVVGRLGRASRTRPPDRPTSRHTKNHPTTTACERHGSNMASDYISNPFEVPNLWRPSFLTVRDDANVISPFRALHLDGRSTFSLLIDAYLIQISPPVSKVRTFPTKSKAILSRI